MEEKSTANKNNWSLVVAAAILSIGMIVSSSIFAFGRPTEGSANGDVLLSGNDIGIVDPTKLEELYFSGNMHNANEFKSAVLDGKIKIPYVVIGSSMYFIKQDIDDWFYKESRK